MVSKKYSEEQEKMARFAKAMGHPARMAILQFLLAQESCYFWRYPRGAAYSQGYGLPASEGTEGCRADSRGD